MFLPLVILGGLIGLFFGGASGMLIGIFLAIAVPFISVTGMFYLFKLWDRK